MEMERQNAEVIVPAEINKRQVEIAADAEEKQMPLDKKPVSAAIDEVYTGKLTIK